MILSVLVWPKPPFQPWTATTAEPGVMIFKANALRRPKRIRLSTYDSSYQDKNVQRRKGAYIRLPLVVLNTSWLRVPEWVASTMQVDLARSLLVSGHCKLVSSPQPTEKRQRTGENGNPRPVLGDQPRSFSTCRQHQERTCALLVRGGDSSNGNRLRSVRWAGLDGPEVIV